MNSIPTDPFDAVQDSLARIRRSPDYRICSRCAMDSTHGEIEFDENGVCNYCHGYDTVVASRRLAPASAQQYLGARLDEIRLAGRGRDYDCVLGVSGGVDSSYLALKCKDWGLRPLMVQFDNGWNTELANHNIQGLCESLGFDLFTYVVNWPEFRDLQFSFIKAGLANVEAPSDHGIFACIYRTARIKGIPFLISGVNNATEANFPLGPKGRHVFSYGYRYTDLYHLRNIHKRFGRIPLTTYPTLGYWHRLWLERSGLVRRLDPLNFMHYVKNDAIAELQARSNWKPYPGKHYESVITRFHQSYILPVRFGMDKRRLHLSGLIWSEQLSRADALAELERPPCDASLLRQDWGYFAKKMGLSDAQLLSLITTAPHHFSEYPNMNWIYNMHTDIMIRLRSVLGPVRKPFGRKNDKKCS